MKLPRLTRKTKLGLLLVGCAALLMAFAPVGEGNRLIIDALGTIWTPTIKDPVGLFVRIDLSDAGGGNKYYGNQFNDAGIVEHLFGAQTVLTGDKTMAIGAWYDNLGTDGGAIATLDTRGQFQSNTPINYDCIYINSIAVAGTTYGGGVGPDQRVTFKDVRSRIRTVGTTMAGPTNAVIRITDGTSSCDCSFLCTTAVGPMSATCAGTTDLDAGSTCTFIGSSALTYGVSTVGTCAPGPDLQGCATIDAVWAINPGF